MYFLSSDCALGSLCLILFVGVFGLFTMSKSYSNPNSKWKYYNLVAVNKKKNIWTATSLLWETSRQPSHIETGADLKALEKEEGARAGTGEEGGDIPEGEGLEGRGRGVKSEIVYLEFESRARCP